MEPGTGISTHKAKSAGERKWRNLALALAVIIVIGVGSIVVRNSMQKASPPSLEVAEQNTAAAPAKKAEAPLAEKPSIAVLDKVINYTL
jgi:hypothetical protein